MADLSIHPGLQPGIQPTGTRSLDRGLSLVQVVACAPRPLTFTEAAELARLPKSTAFRLLGALQRGGLVERDQDGRYHPGWLLHGMRSSATSHVRRALAEDEEFLSFLSERLTEEVIAVTRRRECATDPEAHVERQLAVLDELLRRLRSGDLPDDTTLQLLTQAYAGHPEFREEWRRPQVYAARVARRRG
jgi:hypothetical protein